MRKVLTIALSIAVIATLAVSGTIAYLTDSEEAVNVMKVGKVDIKLLEQQRNDDGTNLIDFESNKLLMPIVGSAQGEKDQWGLTKAKNYAD